MTIGEILRIVPERFRRKSVLVAISIFFKALLDFASVAVLVPVLVKLLNDGADARSVLPFAFAALCFVIVKGVIVVGLSKFKSSFVYSLYSDLSAQVLENFLSRGLLFIRSSDSVDLANKVNAVTMSFVSGVVLALLNAMSALFLLVIMLSALLVYDPVSTSMVFFIMGPLIFVHVMMQRQRVKKLGEEENMAKREQIRSVLEFFRGYPDYMVNCAEDMQRSRFSRAVGKVGEVRLRLETFSALSSGFMEAVVVLAVIIIMLMSVSGSWNISLTFGIFALAAVRLLPAVRSLVGSWQSYKSSSYSIGILSDIFSEKPQCPVASEVAGPLEFGHSLELRNVTFGYPDSGKVIFKNLDMVIKKGEHVGIKGYSGIGKSTLFNLFLGFYTPYEGGLYIDGRKIAGKDVQRWQRMVGYVPQEVFLTRGTFVENVAFGKEISQVDREKVRRVLDKVGLMQWIDTLPDGIDTPLAEAGNSISGGQKQRIGIARALYKDTSVLFLDEATSSVDTDSENYINDSLKELSEIDGNLTVIIIAHRSETLALCDRVIDLEGLE